MIPWLRITSSSVALSLSTGAVRGRGLATVVTASDISRSPSRPRRMSPSETVPRRRPS